MNKSRLKSRVLSIICYLEWICWLIAYFSRDKDDTLVRRHINQAFILNVIYTILAVILVKGNPDSFLAQVGNVLSYLAMFMGFWGILRAIRLSEEPLPLIGKFDLFE